MRVIVMFDLPVITEKERKIATKFRKYLLDDGFIMMQYSVYSRICKNNDDLNKHITENQYNNIILYSGTKTVEEDISMESLLVFE